MIGPIAALAVYGVMGILAALWIAYRLHRALNFRSLLIINYVLVGNLSGIVHLSGVEAGYRGFFDVAASGTSAVATATLGTIGGMVAVCAACLWRLSPGGRSDVATLSLRERRLTSLAVPIISVIAIPAVVVVNSLAEQASSARILSVQEGAARFVFLSHWIVWAITLLALLIIESRVGRSRLMTGFVFLGALVAIALSLAWSGGRSIIVVMALPLVAVVTPRLRGVRWLVLPAVLIAAGAYVVNLTIDRTSGSRITSSIWSWLDWEWGRFSMLGFSQQYVEENGYALGETLIAASSNTVLGVARLLGVFIPNPPLRSMPDVTGQYILGTADTYVVAGMNAELFVNFGMVGVFVGLFVLGMAVAWVDNRFAETSSVLVKLAWAYVGTLLVFRTLAADANAVGSYLVYSGLPVVVLAVIAAVWNRSENRNGSGSRQTVRAMSRWS